MTEDLSEEPGVGEEEVLGVDQVDVHDLWHLKTQQEKQGSQGKLSW